MASSPIHRTNKIQVAVAWLSHTQHQQHFSFTFANSMDKSKQATRTASATIILSAIHSRTFAHCFTQMKMASAKIETTFIIFMCVKHWNEKHHNRNVYLYKHAAICTSLAADALCDVYICYIYTMMSTPPLIHAEAEERKNESIATTKSLDAGALEWGVAKIQHRIIRVAVIVHRCCLGVCWCWCRCYRMPRIRVQSQQLPLP